MIWVKKLVFGRNGTRKRARESETDYSKYDPIRLKVEWHENGRVASKSYNRKGDMGISS